jgi:hypothetical protein
MIGAIDIKGSEPGLDRKKSSITAGMIPKIIDERMGEFLTYQVIHVGG